VSRFYFSIAFLPTNGRLEKPSMNIWLYQATLEEYNLSEQVPAKLHKLDDWRTTRYRDKMKAGDKVILWQSGADAGIYALGELSREPYPEKKTTATAKKPNWWADIRYTHFLESPILKTELAKHLTLQKLSVLSLPFQGNPFFVKRAEWAAIRDLIGSEADPPKSVAKKVLEAIEQIQGKSQGFSVSLAVRKAIEIHAMKRAAAHFEQAGYVVRDVSQHESYDLHCTRGDELLHVEVKGTRSAGQEILLTPGEVRLARKKSPDTALFVVYSLTVTKSDGKPIARGGRVRVLQPWNPDDRRLEALGYTYELPQE
jgi:predicted RNA-binding protein with PUA-like domain